MPMGMTHPGSGAAVYLPVKLAGYTYAAKVLNNNYSKKHNIYLVGTIRTLLGVVFGVSFASLLKEHGQHLPSDSDHALFMLIGILIVLRIVEWWLVIWWFYDRKLERTAQDWGFVALGIIYSFLLDFPAWFFGLLASGVWIC